MNYILQLLVSVMVHLPITEKEPSTGPLAIPVKKSDSATDVQSALKVLLASNTATKTELGFSQKGRAIEAWYFPGISNKKALVIGGVHGSELSSIEVAHDLIKRLQHQQPYYSVIVIPCLFPDNAEAARADRAGAGSAHNTGRYTHHDAVDPNRQMPSLGKPFDATIPVDHLGRTIEPENQLLLDVINQFRPDRIANIHAIRDVAHAGIYADPRTDSKGIALGFATDSGLAISMAAHVAAKGGYVPGNMVDKHPTALYYKDPTPAVAGTFQKRNTSGSQLPLHRGQGVSLGSWASTAIENGDDFNGNRPAMRIVTIEFPGYKAPAHYADDKQQQFCARQVSLYAESILNIFLGEHYVENL